MFGALINYWYLTGDDQYNGITTQALLHQTGPDWNYMPMNQSRSLGNDDQGFWALTVMTAAEYGFPDPPADGPQWLALAQAVFNSQAARWDTATCNGGLKWQIFPFNGGYNYKNTISNGCFFNVAARLGRYTGNKTYIEWAQRTWDWTNRVGLIEDRDDGYHFYDGSDDQKNCTEVDHVQWSYNAGIYLHAAAMMYNISAEEDPTSALTQQWKFNLDEIVKGLHVFFTPEPEGIMFEVACERNGLCDIDQRSFKAYLSRWMAAATLVAPHIKEPIMARLRKSAPAAISRCNKGDDGNQCGLRWWEPNGEDMCLLKSGANVQCLGVGEQMSSLEVVQSLLIESVAAPLTNATGGTSRGDPSAGTGGDNADLLAGFVEPATAGEKAGAAILTIITLCGLFVGAYWMGFRG